MTTIEIRDFLLDTAEEKGRYVSLPAAITSGEGTARLYTKINADSYMLSGGFLSLRINDLRHPATVMLNGNAIGMPTSEEPYYTYDITDRLSLGENLIEICFEGDGLLGAGIFGGVELLRFSGRMIDTLSVESHKAGECVEVDINLTTFGSGETQRAVATLTSSSGQIYYAGLTRGRGKITVKDPLFWWPRGMGAQNLYKLTVNLWGEYEIEDTKEVKIGFCSLTTDGGATEANGEPFTPLGAVYLPVEAASPSAERAEIIAFIGALASSGANSLVIPHGVCRVPDVLYNLCDTYGIVVIHEATSPDSLIKARLMHQGYRPSVGMVDLIGCGDEIDRVTEELRSCCQKTDVNYIEERNEYISVKALPTAKTLGEILPSGEKNPFSVHLDDVREEVVDMISRASEYYPYAPDLLGLSYLSRLCAAKETEEALLASRLLSKRAIYDNVFDKGGLVSSGILDSHGRHTALYYYLIRGFAPTALYAVGEGGCLDFYVMRSARRELSATVELRVLTLDGEPLFVQKLDVTAPGCAVTKLFTRDLSDKISGKEREVYLEYILRDETGVLSRRIHTFTEIRRLKLTKSKVRTDISGADNRFGITLTADAFTAGVEVSFNIDGVYLSDNCVDLAKKAPHKIFLVTDRCMTKEMLREAITVRTVNQLI